MAVWMYVMRFVPEGGISIRDLAERSQFDAKNMQMLLKRVGQWWGYLDVGPDPQDGRAKPPAAEWLVRPSEAGQMAQTIWAPLSKEIESRWNERFGNKAMNDLLSALTELIGRLDPNLPEFLGAPRSSRSIQQPEADTHLPLIALLSKVLAALALDFDKHADLSLGIYTAEAGSRLPVCANVLRLIGDDGVSVAKLPELSGVDKTAIENWVGILDKRRYIVVATDPGSKRRVARLTSRGLQARNGYFQWTGSLESRWPDTRSSSAVRRLRRDLEKICGDLGPGSPLREGMEPYPDGWRSEVPPRQVLPHYPVISPRGGFPDGS
jgi:DNA-binding MarR family transcriptional regulator